MDRNRRGPVCAPHRARCLTRMMRAAAGMGLVAVVGVASAPAAQAIEYNPDACLDKSQITHTKWWWEYGFDRTEVEGEGFCNDIYTPYRRFSWPW